MIAEDDPTTKGLWENITGQIDECDLFLADVSSRSPNIAVELGYAVGRKPERNIVIFIADNIRVPSDLQGFVLQKYSSLSSFKDALIAWLSLTLPMLDVELFSELKETKAEFAEDFKSQDIFLRRWWTPPGCQYSLSHEGLHFTWANLPILTTTLGLLRDCEFEFLGRIEQANVGWVVKGTRHPNQPIPGSCVMFNLNIDGRLLPHVWSAQRPHPDTMYRRFPEQAVSADISKSQDGCFRILTRVRKDVIEVENDNKLLFRADISEAPYCEAHEDSDLKEGQIGFRCHPGEEATVAEVRVREL